jgi:amino acid transporter, AAT family
VDERAPHTIEQGEELSRAWTTGQLGMIAIGGAIGTGLFLGSSLAVRTAGPAVLVSYLIGAVIALLFMGALSEMAVAHPSPGSFGVYAEMYVNPWAGFVVRYSYWAAQCIAIGGEAVAIAIYCQWWFPQTPQWVWVLAFSAALLFVNARSVGSFGGVEYWLAMIKVVAIVLFIGFGLALLAGIGRSSPIGLSNLTVHGGFVPHGWPAVWMAMVFVIFSFIGTEVVAVTAGEARDPARAVPRAMRQVVARLIVFYLGSISSPGKG